tara:strand:+ start:21295 stop:22134 length:840 start_codon:yes stop_codon:yes gene_type:complete
MLKSLDHIIIAVKDLSKSTEFYSNLFGFPSTWEGSHAGLGTKNVLFVFENMYLELLSKSGDGEGGAFVDNHIKNYGEGLAGIALEVSGMQEAKSILKEKGIKINKSINGEGVSSDLKRIRTWESLILDQELTKGIFTILIKHTSKKMLQNKKGHPSNIKRLDHLVIETADPDNAIKLYRDIYGIRLALDQKVKDWGGRMLFFRLNQTTIEVIGRPDSKIQDDNLWGLAWCVDNIEETYNRLMGCDIKVSEVRPGRKANTLVCSLESTKSVIPTLIIQHL